MVAEGLFCRSWPSAAAAAFAILALTVVLAAPAGATPRPAPALTSTDAMLKWINAYRGRPEPDGLPVLVRALSDMQAFKDAESSGAYIGFIAGVLGANPDRAEVLDRQDAADCSRRIIGCWCAPSPIPACRTGARCCATFVDRMPTRQRHDRQISRRQIADARPDRLSDRPSPACSTRSRSRCSIRRRPKKAVALDPSPS